MFQDGCSGKCLFELGKRVVSGYVPLQFLVPFLGESNERSYNGAEALDEISII